MGGQAVTPGLLGRAMAQAIRYGGVGALRRQRPATLPNRKARRSGNVKTVMEVKGR